MFRHPNAILRGLLVPCKLLQFSSAFQVDGAVVRLVWPSAADSDMFRHRNAILRGLLVPCKLLQFSPVFRVDGAVVRLLGPAAAEFAADGHNKRTVAPSTRNADKTGVAYKERVTP
jgi:hypothetical protein